MMSGYILFHLYLISALFSVCGTGMALARKKYNTLCAMLMLLWGSLIGLDAFWGQFVRVFSALYGIVWAG